MNKNYTINRKNIELTEQGKQELVQWALNYYDEQNQEPEAVDIVDVNIPVEQQQLETTLKKLEKVIESMDKKLGLTQELKNRKDKIASFLYGATCGFGGIACISLVAIIVPLISEVIEVVKAPLGTRPLFLPNDSLIHSAYFGGSMILGVTAAIASDIVSNLDFEKRLKKKLDKQRIKQAKKSGKDLEIEFNEDDYTLLTLKKLYSELLAQNESNKKVLEAGV